jgi:hypothetical protein
MGRPKLMIPKRPLAAPAAAASADTPHLYFQVFYDSAVMQSAVTVVCDQLRSAFDCDFQVHTLWSHFQHLADAHYVREAAEVAAQADVVIVATTCRDSLPGGMARWLGSWICQQQKPDAMLCGVFLGEPGAPSRPPPVAAMLQAAASLTGRAWLAGWVRRPPEAVPSAFPALAARASHGSSVHTPLLCHGING